MTFAPKHLRPLRRRPGRRSLSPAPAALLAATLLLSACGGDDGPEPREVSFAPMEVAAFADAGSLTDAWADVDADGDPDRFVGFNGGPARLYRNDGLAGFADVAPQMGLDVTRPVRTAAWGDYDGDGDPDLLLGLAGEGEGALQLWRNEGATFAEVSGEAGLTLPAAATRQASWVDVDADGDLDLYVALRDGPNRLWRNEGGTFSDATEATGLGDARRSVGAVWFDMDADGDLDAYVANMDGDANGMWRNDGGTFTDVAAELGLDAGGRALGDESQGTVRPCAADFDHDGDLDLFTANYGPNGLFRNPGPQGGRWSNVAADVGLAGDSRDDTCAWGDFDNNGLLDLFVNGTVTGGTQYPDRLYRLDEGSYVDVWPGELGELAADHGATWVDVDGDGDLDLSLTGVAEDGMHHVLQNLLRPEFAGHSLKVRVLDQEGRATRAGAEVGIFVPGTRNPLALGIMDTGSGYDAQSDLPVHFGIPGLQPVDLVIFIQGEDGRRTAAVGRINPEEFRGRVLEARIGG